MQIVTMIGWVELPDNELVYLRIRHAIDTSNYLPLVTISDYRYRHCFTHPPMLKYVFTWSFRIWDIDLKFGGVMHCTMQQIAFKISIIMLSGASWSRVLLYSEHLVHIGYDELQ